MFDLKLIRTLQDDRIIAHKKLKDNLAIQFADKILFKGFI
jgi:hypothetical protein